MNLGMQALFRKWAQSSEGTNHQVGSFVDYSEIEFLAELNRRLTLEYEDEALIAQLSQNLVLANELKLEITSEASRSSNLFFVDDVRPATGHLKAMFETLRGRTSPVESDLESKPEDSFSRID